MPISEGSFRIATPSLVERWAFKKKKKYISKRSLSVDSYDLGIGRFVVREDNLTPFRASAIGVFFFSFWVS